MKQANFLISTRSTDVLSVISKLLCCFLIPLGIVAIAGCSYTDITDSLSDRDLEDLSEETLTIILPDTSKVKIGEAKKLAVEVDYSGDDAELKYYWQPVKGTIHGIGKQVIYVAPDAAGNDAIICQVSNGIITVIDAVNVSIVDPGPKTANVVQQANGTEKTSGPNGEGPVNIEGPVNGEEPASVEAVK